VLLIILGEEEGKELPFQKKKGGGETQKDSEGDSFVRT
jgi:hypothetical protein